MALTVPGADKLKISKSSKPRNTVVLVIVALIVVGLIAASRMFNKSLPFEKKIQTNKETVQTTRVVDEESVVIDVVEKVSPSVVSVAVENQQLIDPFFGLPTNREKQSGIGTGFVVSKDGLILTNKHVVSSEDAKYIAIIRGNNGDEKKLPIVDVNRDPFNDLALVRVDASDLTPLELGDSEHLKVGQKVIAIGNALGRFENTVTTGVVSGLGRGVSPVDPSTGIAERLDDLVQTDAAINPGNSGGPLVNSGGQVIGINTAVAEAQNIGFAIKINIAKQLINDFQSSGGKISRPFLGVRYTHISRETALLNDVPEGELVREVVSASSADKAGVKVGDIITQFDGKKLTENDSLSKAIRDKKVGDRVSTQVWRDGNTKDLNLVLGEAPNE
ncbi:trypsin-like peptidase domain-containing protein [Candidatus Curtissbacteria bacterium]|nr:trypsin-like peptidase domain-containing protein [Candidatus Curtissbacteria bacterium]